MPVLRGNYKLPKNNMIVYEVFHLNPFSTFDINELLKIVNKNKQVMSRRTAFRAVKNLTEIGEIYCSNVSKGTRRFELLKNNYYVMICEKCGLKKFGFTKDINTIEKNLDEDKEFVLKRIAIEINGICEKCR